MAERRFIKSSIDLGGSSPRPSPDGFLGDEKNELKNDDKIEASRDDGVSMASAVAPSTVTGDADPDVPGSGVFTAIRGTEAAVYGPRPARDVGGDGFDAEGAPPVTFRRLSSGDGLGEDLGEGLGDVVPGDARASPELGGSYSGRLPNLRTMARRAALGDPDSSPPCATIGMVDGLSSSLASSASELPPLIGEGSGPKGGGRAKYPRLVRDGDDDADLERCFLSGFPSSLCPLGPTSTPSSNEGFSANTQSLLEGVPMSDGDTGLGVASPDPIRDPGGVDETPLVPTTDHHGGEIPTAGSTPSSSRPGDMGTGPDPRSKGISPAVCHPQSERCAKATDWCDSSARARDG